MFAAVVENDLGRVTVVDDVGVCDDISVRGGDNAAAPGVVILAVIVAVDLDADNGGTAFSYIALKSRSAPAAPFFMLRLPRSSARGMFTFAETEAGASMP